MTPTRARRLAPCFPIAPSEWIGHTFWELRHAVSCLARAADFDVITDHTGSARAGARLDGRDAARPHGAWTAYRAAGQALRARRRDGAARGADLGLGRSAAAETDLPWVATCPNALDLSVYPFRPERGDYLLFLGRMTADKGAHHAIAVAIESGFR